MEVGPGSRLTGRLLAWFDRNQRPLPWRQGYDPYQVWISEVMLQQTQMDRVVPFFQGWMARFPSLAEVASAQEDEILKAWEGLGYYSRARNILKCARHLVDKFHGRLPDNYEQLLQLPGIGPYTAAAIASIAFQQDLPVVDANVKRLFARLFDIDSPLASEGMKNYCIDKAASLLPAGQARSFNQALMELGALVCLPRTPLCSSCPLNEFCLSFGQGIVALRPVKKAPQQRTPITVVAGVISHQGRIYIQKRLAASRWGNLWEFPGGHLEEGETPEEAVVREIMEETEFRVRDLVFLHTLHHSFTRYLITLHAYSCKLDTSNTTPVLHAAQDYQWLPLEELDAFAFSSGHRKLLNLLLAGK